MTPWLLRYIKVLLAAITISGCAPPPPSYTNVQPTFSSLSTRVFAVTCSTVSCHGAIAPKANLVLTPSQAYQQLVNVAADNDQARTDGWVRVKPGDPDHSLLVLKLAGHLPANYGDPMPQRGYTLPDFVQQAIRTWIANGALND